MNSPVKEPLLLINQFNERCAHWTVRRRLVEWAWPFRARETMINVINTYTRALSPLPSMQRNQSARQGGGNILGLLKGINWTLAE